MIPQHKLVNKPIRDRMAIIKKQIRYINIMHKSKVMESVIYYDQLEELSNILHKLKLQEK